MSVPRRLLGLMLPLFATVILLSTTLGPDVAQASTRQQEGGDMPELLAVVPVSLPVSSNWDGYVAERGNSDGGITSVKGRWTIPTLTCGTPRTYSSAWVGMDGYSNGTLEQIGTWHYCINGYPMFGAFYQMYPAPVVFPQFPLKPGDLVEGEVRYVDNDMFRVSLRNLTTGRSYTMTASAPNAARKSAAWVHEHPLYDGNDRSLTGFTPIRFTNTAVTVAGLTGGIRDLRWGHTMLVLRDANGDKVIEPSKLSLDGRSFEIKRLETPVP